MEDLYTANWSSYLSFHDDGPAPQTIFEDSTTRVILGALKAGQMIPLHPEEKAVYQFVEGQGVMTINGKDVPVTQGSVVIVPAGANRGMKAETQLIFLAVRMKPAGG